MLGNAGDDTTHLLSAEDLAPLNAHTAPANHQAVFFADRLYGSADFHNEFGEKYVILTSWRSSLPFGGETRSDDTPRFQINLLIGTEAITDATLFKIVRCHLYLYPVTGQNADTVYAHATGERTMDRMILCLRTEDFYFERRIGK